MIELGQLLIIAAIGVFALYIFRLRSLLLDRLIYLFLVGMGVIFTVYPPLSSWLAARVGIGRGVDLIVYIFIIFSLFQFVSISSHLLKQDRQITVLVRECAILGATRGSEQPEHEDVAAQPVQSRTTAAPTPVQVPPESAPEGVGITRA